MHNFINFHTIVILLINIFNFWWNFLREPALFGVCVLLASENFSLYTVVARFDVSVTFLGQLKASPLDAPWPERDLRAPTLIAIRRTLLGQQCACPDVWRFGALALFTSAGVPQVFVYLSPRRRSRLVYVLPQPAGGTSVASADARWQLARKKARPGESFLWQELPVLWHTFHSKFSY